MNFDLFYCLAETIVQFLFRDESWNISTTESPNIYSK